MSYYAGIARIISNRDGVFNTALLEHYGWDSVIDLNTIYFKKWWSIQDEEGGSYQITIKLTQHEDCAYMFVNEQWIGRVTYLREAERIVKAIQENCGTSS